MKLYELAYCCNAYVHLDGFDRRRLTCAAPRVPSSIQGPRFITGRCSRGCGSGAVDSSKVADEAIARVSLSAWWQVWHEQMPTADVTLDQAGDDVLDVIATAFEDLRQRQASWQNRQDVGLVFRGFGPAGASKALYAIRPNSCSPWDDPIRQAEALPGTGAEYRQHLLNSRDALSEAVADLGPDGSATQLPALLNRPDSSPVKLIDEHDWVRFTPPAPAVLAIWGAWAQKP